MTAADGTPQGPINGDPAHVAGAVEAPLVYRSISHRKALHQKYNKWRKVESFLVYPESVKVCRAPLTTPRKPPACRGAIDSFSDKSRRRLRFTAVNASPRLVSMFVATYADGGPKDGRLAKSHLDAFLKRIRRRFPSVGYLWVLEFQGIRNNHAPHYHVFLTLPHSEELAQFLGESWHEVAGNGCEKHLRVALHPRSFIAWDMGAGSYVTKYLDKARQKDVPEGFAGVGRFWGNSRGLVPEPTILEAAGMDAAYYDRSEVKPSVQVVRWLGRLSEKQTRGRSRFRHTITSYTLTLGGKRAFIAAVSYLDKLPPLENPPPPF